MKKIEIAEQLHAKTSLSRSQAIEAVDCVFDIIAEALIKKQSVFIRGFATFKSLKTKPRKGRNISMGTPVYVPAQNSAKLILSESLKEKMNSYDD